MIFAFKVTFSSISKGLLLTKNLRNFIVLLVYADVHITKLLPLITI